MVEVLIRTYPPQFNANYGGLLQAWALQQAVDGMGHRSWIDATRVSSPSASVRVLRRGLGVGRHFLALARLLPERYDSTAVRWAANRQVLAFGSQKLRLANLYAGHGRINARVLERMDAFVVGSDQVWRPDFVNVDSYLLDFLPEADDRTRIAYAASFGSASPEPLRDPRTRERQASFARRFSAISVREDSGVGLVEDLWGLRASQMPDPTLLIAPERYLEISDFADESDSPDLAVYVLDRSAEIDGLISALSSELPAIAGSLRPTLPAGFADFRQDPGEYTRPRVETWLARMYRASFVVTDSFHGTVFAILFNRPFLVVPNQHRGLARFQSLLKTFSLESRIARFDGRDAARMNGEVDWSYVNAVISAERQRGLRFLSDALERRQGVAAAA